MEITQALHDNVVELLLTGRLDALWADHVAAAVSEAVRAGHHQIVLDMSGVDFLSSAGIGVLVRFHKQLHGIGGRLSVVRPSRFVAEVLEGMGLASLIAAADAFDVQRTTVLFPRATRMETDRAVYRVDRLEAGKPFACRVLGDPAWMRRTVADEARCESLACASGTFALGIGVPGDSFAQCRGRFGEFLSVGGALAFLPTGHGHTPDFLLARGSFTPRLYVLHALECVGEPSASVSFQAKPGQSIALADLVEQCLAATGGDTIGVVMAAEVDGLVGSWLRRSPAAQDTPSDPFAFPEVRDWLRFTADRAFTSEVALIVGVASRSPSDVLAPSLRPLDAQGSLVGHFHAAAFSYHPLGKRGSGMAEAVQQLFEWQSLRGLLHLLHDSRPVEGLGQSELVRGACWAGPIDRIAAGRRPEPTKGD